jgi:asparagine synthase (glutamine-hydrolysing)
MGGRADMRDPFEQEGDPDAVEPLMSQRVQQAVAGIPTYVLSANGWDRELARRAFADCLPQRIARRRSKGAINENMHALLAHNLAFVRSMLCGGLLEQKGMLDRAALDGFLGDDPQSPVMVGEVFHMLSAECRLRAWESP